MEKFLENWASFSLVFLGLLMLLNGCLPWNLSQEIKFIYIVVIIVAAILIAVTLDTE